MNAPKDVYFTLGVKEVRFQCEASSDDSTPVTITWKKDNEPITISTYQRITITSRELIINTLGLSLNDIRTRYVGEFLCEARNGHSFAEAKAAFKYGKRGYGIDLNLWSLGDADGAFLLRIPWEIYWKLVIINIESGNGFYQTATYYLDQCRPRLWHHHGQGGGVIVGAGWGWVGDGGGGQIVSANHS